MAGRDWKPRTLERWTTRPLKNANPPTAPNVIVKEDDLPRLLEWEVIAAVPIIVIHVFDQEAFAVRLSKLRDFQNDLISGKHGEIQLQVTTGIWRTIQGYDRVDAQGAAEKKPIFRVSPCAAVKVGEVVDVKVAAQLGLSGSKKYVTHAIFSGGKLELSGEFLDFLRKTKLEYAAASPRI